MGAWGIKSFENDDASDWLYDLEESDDLSVIQKALQLDNAYIEAPECCNALAAAEVVLALLGKPRPGIPENAMEWVNKNPIDPSLIVPSAIDAVSLVLSGNSELNELWAETDEHTLWQEDVKEILRKLKES